MRFIIDIEADNLLMKATKIWCIVLKNIDTGITLKYSGEDIEIAYHLIEEVATELIGHNITMYDLPLMNKLSPKGFNYSKVKLFDTLIISRLLNPDRMGGHSLNAWGKRLGDLKGEFKDFSHFSDEMLEYCEQDVQVTHKVYDALVKEVALTTDINAKWFNLEHNFAEIINKQIEVGFTLDVDKAEGLHKELENESVELTNTLSQIMPKIKEDAHYKEIKKSNRLLSETHMEYTYITPKTEKVVTKEFKFTEPNPTSRQQVATYLKTRGWHPQIRTETGLPKIDEKILNGIDLPEAKMISRLFRVQKQMSMIKNDNGGWLYYVNRNTNRVHGDVLTNATNTGRCSHSQPNMAQVDKRDKRMRAVWIPKEGWNLVGVDASGLELRVLAHYLHSYDKGRLAFEVTNGDVHTSNQEIMGLEQRDSAKTAIYALIYGAGNAKLGMTVAKDKHDFTTDDMIFLRYGKQLRSNVEEGFIGYKQLVKDVGDAYRARGYLKGLDGRPLNPRTDYSALNLLIQSAGAIICKQWVINWWQLLIKSGLNPIDDFNFIANVHDEEVVECKPGLENKIIELAEEAMKQVQKDFNLKVALGTEGKVGKSWADVH